MTCQCPVCAALAGLPPLRLTEAGKLVRELPPDVRKVLAAQDRVRREHPRPGDRELVKAAAERCTAGRWELPNTH